MNFYKVVCINTLYGLTPNMVNIDWIYAHPPQSYVVYIILYCTNWEPVGQLLDTRDVIIVKFQPIKCIIATQMNDFCQCCVQKLVTSQPPHLL